MKESKILGYVLVEMLDEDKINDATTVQSLGDTEHEIKAFAQVADGVILCDECSGTGIEQHPFQNGETCLVCGGTGYTPDFYLCKVVAVEHIDVIQKLKRTKL